MILYARMVSVLFRLPASAFKATWLWWSAVLMSWWSPHRSFERRTSPWPVRCHCCGWLGRRRQCRHGYVNDGQGDVEPMDFCPNCDYEL